MSAGVEVFRPGRWLYAVLTGIALMTGYFAWATRELDQKMTTFVLAGMAGISVYAIIVSASASVSVTAEGVELRRLFRVRRIGYESVKSVRIDGGFVFIAYAGEGGIEKMPDWLGANEAFIAAVEHRIPDRGRSVEGDTESTKDR